jgi:hypothetical protein
MTLLTNPVFRKLDTKDQEITKELIFKSLCEMVSEGYLINKSEILTGKRLQISSSIIGQVSCSKKFKDYYLQKRNR